MNPATTRCLESLQARFGYTPNEVLSRSRKQPLAWARQIAMWLLYTRTKMGYRQVAEELNRKDHGTVLHACKVVELARGGSVAHEHRDIEAMIKLSNL
mgnify:CR=1 FL=1